LKIKSDERILKFFFTGNHTRPELSDGRMMAG